MKMYQGENQPTLFGPPAKAVNKKPEQWLIEALKTKTGGFRNTRWQRCPTCKQITLTGINSDNCAWTITVDPTPLTPHDELLCTLTGRDTASAIPKGTNYELHHRAKDMIQGHPPGKGLYGLVFPNHQCGARFPGFHKPHSTAKWDPTKKPEF
ncbi:hypothetical protein [Glutamicibacter arilaitensis]|uniref:hypothetical protein n=1 Tax=Glutamicibacter arilaitensis TaxID=256701 RepID=UPI00384A4649